jgi:hypothetical protein
VETESHSGPRTVYIIKCFEGKPDDVPKTTTFNAEQVRSDIKKQYKLD